MKILASAAALFLCFTQTSAMAGNQPDTLPAGFKAMKDCFDTC